MTHQAETMLEVAIHKHTETEAEKVRFSSAVRDALTLHQCTRPAIGPLVLKLFKQMAGENCKTLLCIARCRNRPVPHVRELSIRKDARVHGSTGHEVRIIRTKTWKPERQEEAAAVGQLLAGISLASPKSTDAE